MKRYWKKHLILGRLLVSLGLVLLYVLGRYIPLPYVLWWKTDRPLSEALSQVGVFSLGLGPMMYGLLLNQLFHLGRRMRPQSPKIATLRQNSLILLVALIQGMGLAIGFQYQKGLPDFALVFQVGFLLATGAMVLTWLSGLNSRYGLGGQMLLMLASMLLGQFQRLPAFLALWQEGQKALISLMVAWLFLTIYLVVVLERAEYRIVVQRLLIHNRYADQSYLPFKLNISGGMPLMYAYTFLTLPQYALILTGYLAPDWKGLERVMPFLTTSHLSGVLLYMAIILGLSFVTAFVTVDVTRLSEDLRQAGDYLPSVRPGKETKVYLSQLVRRIACFNGFYLALLAGFPLLMTLGAPDAQGLAGLIGVVMMASSMLLTVLEEVSVLRLKRRYQPLFD